MIECKFCGAENEDTREACWNCFAPLKGTMAEALKGRMAPLVKEEAVPREVSAEAPPLPRVRKGLSVKTLVGIIVALAIVGGGFFFYRTYFLQKPVQVAQDFTRALINGIVNQDLSLIKPYIDPSEALELPASGQKEETQKKIKEYLQGMGVQIPSQVMGMNIFDLISTLKPTITSLSAERSSSSLKEARVNVQVSLQASSPMPGIQIPASLNGGGTVVLVRQGLDWKVSLSKTFPSVK